MEEMNKMTTLVDAINYLREKGYVEDYKFENNRLIAGDKKYKADDLKIVEVHRFEGESDPSDMSVLFGIETEDGTKGILIDAYGFYGSQDSGNIEDFIKQVERTTH
ncbi:MAG TPA: hypothetical protein VHO28_16315 [Ignavibacteriales bacterium]|nr:hypothetical protein [Ignavibacteriales bacterium]